MDAATTYLQTFQALRRRKRWSVDTNVLRFAALAIGTVDTSEPYARLEATAETLRKGAGWFGPLKSPVRYVVAAMILRQGLSARHVHSAVKRTREAMRRRKLPRGALPQTLASVLLVLDRQGSPVPTQTLERMERIMARWKEDHRWLTRADDLPTAALHAARDVPVESIAVETEHAYQALRDHRYSRGNALQLVSHMLAFDPRGVDTAVSRFLRIANKFGDAGWKIRVSRYDEAAILSLSQGTPDAVVDRALRFVERLRAERPRPGRDIAFSLAAGLVLAEDARKAGPRSVADLGQLQAAQAIIAAQQAAMVAAIAASSAATTAATSG
ncbi:MAG: DUF4003 family protein [Acidobacteriota bacterium]|jgi:hypothetical protein